DFQHKIYLKRWRSMELFFNRILFIDESSFTNH
ncbi:hypothetical protein EAI_01593, partial [Harpegnathos saltator]